MIHQPPPIDLAHLNDIAGDDPEFIQELLDVFLTDAERLLALIQEAHAQGNAQELKQYGHQLKGSSANVGAEALRELASGLEEATIPPQTLVMQLPPEISRIRAFVQSM